MRRISDLKETVETYRHLLAETTDLKNLLELAENEEEKELFAEAVLELARLKADFEEFELSVLFVGEYDRNHAIVSLHAGAGGTMPRIGRCFAHV